jgi:hypothetical protein
MQALIFGHSRNKFKIFTEKPDHYKTSNTALQLELQRQPVDDEAGDEAGGEAG